MRWTEWEESYLRENAHRGFKAVARELHRSIKSIYGKAARLGIEPTTAPHLSWEEISYVKNNSRELPNTPKGKGFLPYGKA